MSVKQVQFDHPGYDYDQLYGTLGGVPCESVFADLVQWFRMVVCPLIRKKELCYTFTVRI
jgi:hypothetical protein